MEKSFDEQIKYVKEQIKRYKNTDKQLFYMYKSILTNIEYAKRNILKGCANGLD